MIDFKPIYILYLAWALVIMAIALIIWALWYSKQIESRPKKLRPVKR